MERFLKPERLDVDPSVGDADKLYKHWKKTFDNFLESLEEPNKLSILVNFVSARVYEYIAECDTFEDAIEILKNTYIKPKNEVFARHLLYTCKQEQSDSLDQFLSKLKSLAKDCNFIAVTADKHRDDAIRDAFISGLTSCNIRQRLLEKEQLDLKTAFDTARSLEMAEKQNMTFTPGNYTAAAVDDGCDGENTSAASQSKKCYFCGNNRHPRIKCPAKDVICNNCEKKGHFAKVCLSKKPPKPLSAMHTIAAHVIASSSSPPSLSKAVTPITIDGHKVKALVDTGSSESFIDASIVKAKSLRTFNSKTKIAMATNDHCSHTQGHIVCKLKFKDQHYNEVKLSILPNLCSDVILGHDFLKKHEKVEIPFEGPRKPFSLCGLAAAKVEPPFLFENLTDDCKPIATKSRRFNNPDRAFITAEVGRLLEEDIIEPSKSPWRAQVLITSNENHKKRMVVDYSQTINRFTELDAYPSKRIDELVERFSQYEYYSTFDLKSAYHQIPLQEREKKFTAFEADGNLYQFKRVPFGVTNGVAVFQRIVDDILRKEAVPDTEAYVDNVTVGGRDKKQHDENVQKFLQAAKKYGLTFNEPKSIRDTKELQLLGYSVSKGQIKPDPERLQPLKEMKPPTNLKAQERIVGMFAYYSQWIQNFSDKAYPLIHNKTFPLTEDVEQVFDSLKKELENAVLMTFDPKVPLVVETDASDVAVGATLNQNNRPVAFYSRTLSGSEIGHSTVEKEAQAIVEACRKWKHYLIGNHFKLLTDQRSVAFMFDNRQRSKIKNEKIQRWRLELSSLKFDSIYRPGCNNAGADPLSRICGSATVIAGTPFSPNRCQSNNKHCANSHALDLRTLHERLCHPGITRLMHFIRTKNLPFSLDEVRRVTAQCKACAETKPQFFKPPKSSLIKATQSFERLSVDFKGPLPSITKNKYLLTMIDEYSRFPFAFPCQDMTTATVIKCHEEIFSLFGTASFVHSDRGPSFMSKDVKNYLSEKGVATSRTTPYNPQGNGQVEKLNDTLWKAINVTLKGQGLPVTHWEEVLPQALHSIRSLLCTATNETPHERFFTFNRKSGSGTSLPTWLLKPGLVLMKKNVRQSKYDPLVEEVELLECNPQYASIRYKDGRESTVSIKQLAPAGRDDKDLQIQDLQIQLPSNEAYPEVPSNSSDQHETQSEIQENTHPGEEASQTENSTTAQQNQNPSPDQNHELLELQGRVHPYSLRSRSAALDKMNI